MYLGRRIVTCLSHDAIADANVLANCSHTVLYTVEVLYENCVRHVSIGVKERPFYSS